MSNDDLPMDDSAPRLLRHAEEGPVPRNKAALEEIIQSADLGGFSSSLQGGLEVAAAHASEGTPWLAIDALVQLAEELFELNLDQLAALVLGRARTFADPHAPDAPSEQMASLADLENATAVLALRFNELDRAELRLAQALDLAERSSSASLVAAVALNQAHLALRLGLTDSAWSSAMRSLDAAQKASNGYSEVRALITLIQLPARNASDRRRQSAFAERGLELARRLRSPALTSSVNNASGLLQALGGHHEAAHQSFRRALRAANRTGNPDRKAVALQNLAAVSSDLGRFQVAVRYLHQAVEHAGATPGQARLNELLESLARNQNRAGQIDAAIETCESLLARHDANSSGADYARVLGLYGALLADAEHITRAAEVLSTARSLLVDVAPGDPDTARATTNLTLAHLRAGTLSTVSAQMPIWLEALPEAERRSAARKMAMMAAEDAKTSDAAIAPLLQKAMQGQRAAGRTMEALTIAAQLSYFDRHTLAIESLRAAHNARRKTERDSELTLSVRNDLALALIRRADRKDFSEARHLLEANLRSADRRNDRVAAHMARVNLTELARRLNDLDVALVHARQALKLSTALGDRALMFVDALQVARVHTDHGHPGRARGALDRASKYVASRAEEARLAESMARNALIDGRSDDAVLLYREAIRKSPRDVHPSDAFETLAGLLEAYAVTERRPAYIRGLRRLIDLAQELPHDMQRVVSFLRLANAWSARARPAFAGEMLALSIIIAAAHAASARPDDEVETPSNLDPSSDESLDLEYMTPLFVTVGAVAYTLRDWEAQGRRTQVARQGLVRELARHLEEDTVETLVDLIHQAERDSS